MMIKPFIAFVRITGWLPQLLCFRTKIHYEDAAVQKRRIKGPAIIVSNHTSVYDYAVYLFVFISRVLRFQMAEVLYERKPLALLLKMLGGIRVDRNGHDFGFVIQSEDILNSGGVVGIFPESRLPRAGETTPLEFKTSAAYIALSSGAPIIPVYTDGSYFKKKRANVIIGKPFYASELTDSSLSDKENIALVSNKMRSKIIELRGMLDERTKGKKA